MAAFRRPSKTIAKEILFRKTILSPNGSHQVVIYVKMNQISSEGILQIFVLLRVWRNVGHFVCARSENMLWFV